jgi:hypothetical protein
MMEISKWKVVRLKRLCASVPASARRLYACRLGGAQSPSATVSLELKRVYLLQPHRTNYQLFFVLLSFNCSYHFFGFILLPTHSNANHSALAEFDRCSRSCGDGFNGSPKSPLTPTLSFHEHLGSDIIEKNLPFRYPATS